MTNKELDAEIAAHEAANRRDLITACIMCGIGIALALSAAAPFIALAWKA